MARTITTAPTSQMMLFMRFSHVARCAAPRWLSNTDGNISSISGDWFQSFGPGVGLVFVCIRKNVRLWPIVDIPSCPADVRFWGKADMAFVVANSKIKIQNFSGALLGPLAQSLFSARVPIAPAPHFFWFSMPCPIRQIHDASDIGTIRRQRCRAQFPLPPICKLDMSPLPISLMWCRT